MRTDTAYQPSLPCSSQDNRPWALLAGRMSLTPVGARNRSVRAAAPNNRIVPEDALPATADPSGAVAVSRAAGPVTVPWSVTVRTAPALLWRGRLSWRTVRSRPAPASSQSSPSADAVAPGAEETGWAIDRKARGFTRAAASVAVSTVACPTRYTDVPVGPDWTR